MAALLCSARAVPVVVVVVVVARGLANSPPANARDDITLHIPPCVPSLSPSGESAPIVVQGRAMFMFVANKIAGTKGGVVYV